MKNFITLTLLAITLSYTSHALSPIIPSTGTVCIGSTLFLVDTPGTGVWTSSAPAIATVGSAGGMLTGISAGVVTITYTLGSSYVTGTYTVNPSFDTLSGPTTVCVGATITLSSTTPGGTWTCVPSSVATIDSVTGVVTGISAGTAMIDYSVTGTCVTGVVGYTITVSSSTSAGTITGSSTTYVGMPNTLTDGVPGGTWSSSNANATVGASTGIVTGVSPGTDTISYTVTGCTGTATATFIITILPLNSISGNVLFTSGPDTGGVEVWLITYNTTTHNLEAIDSAFYTSSGTSVFYQFLGAPTDSYRIKASVLCSLCSSTGYIPTYHNSHYYWHDADVLFHTFGTNDINQDITMAYGTATTGPGFMTGDVTTGANKGTSGGAPAVGLNIYLINSTTNAVIQQALTDASGHYSFSNLPVGQTYYVHPEAINYITTPYTSITLTAAVTSMTSASFTQHTISKTITPHTSGVISVTPSVTSVTTFPNPTNGKLYIQWQENTTEQGHVTIADITGRELINISINITQGTGRQQIDLSDLANGLYIINVKSGSINYYNKIQVQH